MSENESELMMVDPALGYVKGNVVVVSKAAADMLEAMPVEIRIKTLREIQVRNGLPAA